MCRPHSAGSKRGLNCANLRGLLGEHQPNVAGKSVPLAQPYGAPSKPCRRTKFHQAGSILCLPWPHFGVASAPAIFHLAMDTISQGILHVVCYLGDILVTGESEANHLRNLEEVLWRLIEKGVHLNRDKCCIFQSFVEYFGH